MPATKKQSKQDPPAEVAIPEVEDGSVVVEGTDYGTLRTAGAKVIGALIAALDTADGASLAGALLMGIIARSIRDSHGFPVWSKADWPETANKLFADMLADAGLGDDAGKRFTNAIRSAWSRSTGPCNVRDSLIAIYVCETTNGAKVMTTGEVSTVAAQNHAAALEILGPDLVAMLPEELQAGPYNVSTVNAACKKAAAEQLHHYKLTVPVRFGGQPKDSSDTQAKLDESPETVLGEVANVVTEKAGTEGGPSFLSLIRGMLQTSTAYALALATANVKNAESVQDRAAIVEYAARFADVAAILPRIAEAENTPEDLELLRTVGYDPESDK